MAVLSQLMEKVRISKLMAERGMCSRREADSYIERGWVKVDGVVATLGERATAAQTITLHKNVASQQGARVTILINKPMAYVSGQAEDGHIPAVALVIAANRARTDRSPIQFDRSQLRGLAVAGRLDIEDSEIEKEYLVRVQGKLRPGALELLNEGLSLDGKRLKRAMVEWQNADQLRFVLREGKKRQIRRMCELVGLTVLGLKRVRIGRVMLADLPVGQWRYLGQHESF